MNTSTIKPKHAENFKAELGYLDINDKNVYILYGIASILQFISFYISYKYFGQNTGMHMMYKFLLLSGIYWLFIFADYKLYQSDKNKKYLLVLMSMEFIIALMLLFKALTVGKFIYLGKNFDKAHIIIHTIYIFTYYFIYMYDAGIFSD